MNSKFSLSITSYTTCETRTNSVIHPCIERHMLAKWAIHPDRSHCNWPFFKKIFSVSSNQRGMHVKRAPEVYQRKWRQFLIGDPSLLLHLFTYLFIIIEILSAIFKFWNVFFFFALSFTTILAEIIYKTWSLYWRYPA